MRNTAVNISVVLLFVLLAVPANATKYVKWNSPGPVRDGSSWCNAFQTIQQALDVAADSEVVKVAQGTYVEKIVFKSGAVLQGGWRGNCPSTPPDPIRDKVTYVTTIDGGTPAAGTVTVTGFTGAVIDGFTILGGETGVKSNGTATVNGNIISGSGSYGINCTNSVTVSANTISSNGIALYCSSSATISGNTISAGTTGIRMSDCSPTITGNTIDGGGVGATGVACYSTIWCGGYGVCQASITDNRFSNWANSAIYCQGSYRWCLNGCSGCVWQARSVCAPNIERNTIAGGQIGVHCYDSSPIIQQNAISSVTGITCVATASHYYPGGPGIVYYNGLCAASISQNTISDCTGNGIYCYAVRHYDAIDGDCQPTISNNKILRSGQSGVACNRATPTISGNTITDSMDCGVYCYNNVSGASMITLTIDSNVISGQKKGIRCYGASVTVKNNTILLTDEEGVLCESTTAASNSDVTGNMIYGGTVGIKVAGTITVSSNPNVLGNIIVGPKNGAVICQNSSSQVYNNLLASGGQYGVDCQGGSPQIWNNTIVKNGWYGVYVESGTPAAYNNIISGSPIGCYVESGTLILGYNNLWANDMDYYGVTKPATDISVDPSFLAPAVGEYHLKPGSPCMGVGDNTHAGAPKDADGKDRILPVGGVVDIGCFEWDETPYWVRSAAQAKVVSAQYGIEMKNMAVSAAWTDAFYLEDYDRKSGIRVEKVAHGLAAADMRAGAIGVVQTNSDGERCLQASSVAAVAGSAIINPLGMNGRTTGGGSFLDPGTGIGQQAITGGSGLNNIGLLVRVWGRVTEVESGSSPAWFKIDDGSNRQIRCIAEGGNPAISPLWLNRYVSVTGVSSCEFDGLNLVSKIRIKKEIVPVLY